MLLSIFSYFWSEIGGINFVERDESVANHSSILSCAGMSQREKKSFSITLISLQSATAFWLPYEKNIQIQEYLSPQYEVNIKML